MPYKNEYSCRLVSPDEINPDSFRRVELGNMDIIWGKKEGKMIMQSIRYDKEKWTQERAKAHCMEHQGKFENNFENNSIFSLLNLNIDGIIEYSGESSKGITTIESIRKILDSSKFSAIFLDINSPCGAVEGLRELGQTLRSYKVPIIAYINPMACSGAYWLASFADKIYLSCATARVGSIGVVAIHEDLTEKEKAEGIKISEITAGQYKRLDSPHKALTLEGKALIQAQVDYIHHLFNEDVSKNRSIPIERVIGESGNGKVFIGQQAIDVGLADEICEKNILIERLNMKVQEEVDYMKENEELKKKIEELNKLIEELKLKLAPEMLEKKEEEIRVSERKRIEAIEEIAPKHVGKDILLKARNEGWSIEKSAFEFLKEANKQSKLSAENVIVNNVTSIEKSIDIASRLAGHVNKERR